MILSKFPYVIKKYYSVHFQSDIFRIRNVCTSSRIEDELLLVYSLHESTNISERTIINDMEEGKMQ